MTQGVVKGSSQPYGMGNADESACNVVSHVGREEARMDVKSVFDYIERRYNSLVSYLDRGLADKDYIKAVSAQCFGVVDYFNAATHDEYFGETAFQWEMWSAKFDSLYGR